MVDRQITNDQGDVWTLLAQAIDHLEQASASIQIVSRWAPEPIVGHVRSDLTAAADGINDLREETQRILAILKAESN